MHPFLEQLGLLGVGLVLLLVGGRLLVSASVDVARRLGVPPLLVGLTLVAWGTSAPELALNLVSALKDRGDIALGNVVGASICNLGLVLGVCALIRPLKVQDRLVHVEVGLNAAMMTLLGGIGLLGLGYQRWAAGLLLAVFVVYSAVTIRGALSERRSGSHLVPTAEPEGYPLPPMSWARISLFMVTGVAMLSFGGSLASDAAAGMAESLGVPPAIVAVTIVSIGTTLPEMFTGILAVRRGQVDLAMGNAIGSCIFNTGAIFGIAGLIAPPPSPPGATATLGTMVLLGVLLIPVSRTHGRTVSRLEGILLLGIYAAFLGAQALLAGAAG